MLDPMPVSLLKQCPDQLVTPVTQLINSSLNNGSVPLGYKSAVVTPILKKSNLDPESLSNFRPVSNLPFWSKVLERVVAQQLHQYLQDNSLYESMQSAYRSHYSTETALLRVSNDILITLDEGREVLLLLLDLSAAFDTIDHQILVTRLSERYGITATALQWVTSYLTDRTQKVSINGHTSNETKLLCGVPQGSVLGPLLFTLYTAPIGELIRRHGLPFMLYADDTQLYVKVEAGNELATIHRLERCLSDIRSWMSENKLCLNDGKTELLRFSSKFRISTPQHSVAIGSNVIVPSSVSVRNLGAMFDDTLTMEDQVKSVCRSATFSLYSIGKIRRYLNYASIERLICSFVTSRLDNYNSLLHGIPGTLMGRLQRVQNSAARLLTGTGKYEHITPVLHRLHWLPIKARIHYKILLTVYKALHGLAPEYIRDLLHIRSSLRTSRSSSSAQLTVPRVNTAYYGDRAFSVSGPKLWNSLPPQLQNTATITKFKKDLKTHLFRLTYD